MGRVWSVEWAVPMSRVAEGRQHRDRTEGVGAQVTFEGLGSAVLVSLRFAVCEEILFLPKC